MFASEEIPIEDNGIIGDAICHVSHSNEDFRGLVRVNKGQLSSGSSAIRFLEGQEAKDRPKERGKSTLSRRNTG